MVAELLARLGVANSAHTQGDYPVYTPIDGSQIASVTLETKAQVVARIDSAHSAFLQWRTVPAPRRGELVRIFGEVLREHKADLGELVSVEAGKITQEGLGEVQEMIDICDFAVGLSRQLYGLTIASERPGHHMRETWHPLGVVGVISAFNFPVAVWAWNTTLALVCGNPVIWKPSEKTPLTALACQALFDKALKIFGDAPAALAQLVIGDRDAGEALVDTRRRTADQRHRQHPHGPRSRTACGCTFRPQHSGTGWQQRHDSGPERRPVAVRGILFSAVGTAGQRCTTLRRLIVHRSIKDEVVSRVKAAYAKVRVGDPREGNLIGPLIDQQAFSAMQNALAKARDEGGQVFGGERQLQEKYPNGYYVTPAIAEMPGQSEVVRHETFAPILYVLAYDDFEEALRLNNEVPQGLSSCIFTTDLREAEAFQSAAGSDCGIANVNIGTSGAEIGGAFGGEKETGGGRESGSDSWRAYMRRQTNTVNYSRELPLAQGIVFD